MNNPLTDNILLSIKKLLGIDQSITDFDSDIIMHINSVFVTLYQMGVGTDKVYEISSGNETWDEFINDTEYNSVKTYVYLKTKLAFDPPLNGSILESFNKQISELEWRLNFAAEHDVGGDQNG